MSRVKEISCAIYKTKKRDGVDVYVKQYDDYSAVPVEMIQQIPLP